MLSVLQNSVSPRQSIPGLRPAPSPRGDTFYVLFKYSAALHYFLRRTDPFEPVEPVEPTEPAEPLLFAIKGQHAQGANPEPLSLPAQILYNFIDTF